MKRTVLLAVIAMILIFGNTLAKNPEKKETNNFPSWNKNFNDPAKGFFCIDDLKNYIHQVTNSGNKKSFIPVPDRVAVFDMDGTLACEWPFSMELYCAYNLAFDKELNCSDDKSKVQQSVLDAFNAYLPGLTSDSLVRWAQKTTTKIENHCIPHYSPQQKVLSELFYQPMIEVIEYLLKYDFKVYIVSGSSQQFIWGIVQNVPTLSTLEPSHIIGSLQKYKKFDHRKGKGPRFYLDSANFLSNVSQGKAINIYNRIGKKPVIAFGNTVNDFDMFSYTSYNNKYKTLCVLINHDSNALEAEYLPFDKNKKVCKNWNEPPYCEENWNLKIFHEIMQNQDWKVANISKCFNPESVFVKSPKKQIVQK